MVYKLLKYVSTNTIKSIYYAIFDSHLNYDNFLWGQNITTIKCSTILPKKGIKISKLQR